MEITDLKLIERNKIEVSDALKMPLLRMKVEVSEETIVPETNDLIVYVNEKTYTFNLTNKLNVGDIFEIKPIFNGKKIEQTTLVKRNDNTIETLTYKDIILNEGQNTITTNYENALIEVVYPKDTDLVNYFLTTMTNSTTPSTGNVTVDDIYPVGSIYMSLNSTDPTTLFGGTWERIAKGRTLVGIDEEDTDFNIVNKTGGSKYLQKHKHKIFLEGNNETRALVPGTWKWSDKTQQNYSMMDNEGTGNSGNLQPYLTCYIWARTE